MSQNNWNKSSTTKQLEEVQLTDNIRVIMPDDIANKIKYLCKTIPRQEWSGILLYTVEGSIKQPKDMMITLQEIIVMDKGSAARTEYNFNEKKRDNSGYLDRHIDYTNEHEEAIFWKIGQIHSHHSMNVFFSTVDMEELNDNSGSHNYYLSLIVNNYMDMIAKVAFRASVDTTVEADYKALDDEGEEYTVRTSKFSVKKEKLFTHNCTIESPMDQIVVSKEFADNVADVIRIADTPKVTTPVNKVENTVAYSKPNIPISQTKSQGIVNPNISKNQAKREIGFQKPFNNIQQNMFNDEDLYDNFGYADDELDLWEILAMAAFNGGSVNEQHHDIIDTLYELEVFLDDDVTPDTICNSFMEVYVESFKKYYDGIADDEGIFEDVTQKVIALLEENEEEYKFLSKTIMSLKYMLNKLEQYANSTI